MQLTNNFLSLLRQSISALRFGSICFLFSQISDDGHRCQCFENTLTMASPHLARFWEASLVRFNTSRTREHKAKRTIEMFSLDVKKDEHGSKCFGSLSDMQSPINPLELGDASITASTNLISFVDKGLKRTASKKRGKVDHLDDASAACSLQRRFPFKAEDNTIGCLNFEFFHNENAESHLNGVKSEDSIRLISAYSHFFIKKDFQKLKQQIRNLKLQADQEFHRFYNKCKALSREHFSFESVEIAFEISSCKSQDQVFQILESYVEVLSRKRIYEVMKLTHEPENAQWIVQWVQKHYEITIVHKAKNIKCLINSSNWGVIDFVESEMVKNGVKLNNQIYCLIISSAIKSRKFEQAFKWHEKMKKSKCDPDLITYNTIMNAYGKAGMMDQAMRILDEMMAAGFSPDLFTYNTLLSSCESSSMFNTGMELFNTMVSNGIKPDVLSYTTVINLHNLSGGCAEQVLRLYAAMKKSSIKLDIACYTALIDALGRHARFDRVFDILTEIDEAGLNPDSVFYHALIKLFCRHDMMGHARYALKQMNPPTDSAYLPMINHFLKCCKYKEAVGLCTEMRAECSSIGNYAYEVMIRVYAISGQMSDAEMLFSEMKQKGLVPSIRVYGMLMTGFGNAYSVAKVHALMDLVHLERVQLNLRFFNIMINVYGKLGLISYAESMFKRIKQRDMTPDIISYSSLMSVRMDAGLYHDVIALYRDVKVACLTMDRVAYSIVIKAYCLCHMYNDADILFDEMTHCGFRPSKHLCCLMLGTYGKLGMHDKHVHLCNRMVNYGYEFDDVSVQLQGFDCPVELGNGIGNGYLSNVEDVVLSRSSDSECISNDKH